MNGHVLDRLSAYMDGELSASEGATVRDHLGDCPECSRRLDELVGLDEKVRELPAEAPEGYFDSFPHRVRQRLEAGRRPAVRRLPAWAWPVAAALLVSVLVGTRIGDWFPAPPAVERSGARAGKEAPEQQPPEMKSAEESEAAAPLRTPPAQHARAAARAADKDEANKASKREDVPSKTPGDMLVADGRRAPFLLESRSDLAADRASPEGANRQLPRQETQLPGPGGPRNQNQQGQVINQTGIAGGAPPSGVETATPKAVPPAAPPPPAEAAEPLQKSKGEDRETAGYGRGRPSDPAEERFGALRKATLKDAVEARRSRESWRLFCREHPFGPRADEARVMVIEAGALAYRLGGDKADLETLKRDAEAYLEREEAPRRARVRAILKSFEHE